MLEVHDNQQVVSAARGNPLAVGAPIAGTYVVAVASQFPQRLASVRIPDYKDPKVAS